jgi:Listeria-Bacteroides repeat domain (List_Bact_rpt)
MLALAFTLLIPAPVQAASKKKPAKVTVTSVKTSGTNKVVVKWKKAKYATNYRIYWKQAGTKKWRTLATVKSNKTTYTHKSNNKARLVAGKKYVYTVRAYNKYGKKWGSYNTKGKTVMIPKKKAAPPATAPVKPKPTTQTPAKPTAIPAPIKKPQPTAKPKPTATPVPTATPTPLPRATKIWYDPESYTVWNIGSQVYALPMVYPDAAYATTWRSIEVTSSDESVLKPDPIDRQYMIAVGPGTATITARTTDGTNLTASYYVTVENRYLITLDYNDGASRYSRTLYKPGDIIHMSDEKATRDGYIFDGWYTEPEGGERVITFTVNSSTTLYAHWIKKDSSESATVENVYLDGSDIYRCIVRGEDFPADVKVSDVQFELLNNEDIVGSEYTEYHEYTDSSWVSFHAQRAGKMQVVAKYNGTILMKWNITVATDWAEYVGYVNWRKQIESQIWTSSMSLKEKMDAAKDYIQSHFVHKDGSDAAVSAYKGNLADCITASEFMGDFAKDTNAKVQYGSTYTGKFYDYITSASSDGGHTFTRILINNEWVIYDANPPHA